MNILKTDSEKRQFVAVVYRAGAPADAQGDTMSVDELQMAVMRFAQRPHIKLEHGDEDMPQGLVTVLGSYMTGKAGGGLPRNAWIIEGRVARGDDGDILWARIKAGRQGKKFIEIDGQQHSALSGFSMAGKGLRVEVG